MRKLAIACLAGGIALVALTGVGSAAAQSTDDNRNTGYGTALVVEVTGLLDPVMASFIEDSVAEAHEVGARLLVFRFDSHRSVVDDDRLAELADLIVASPVPVAVWVGPNGSSVEGKVAQLVGVTDAVAIAPGTRLGNLGPPLPALADYPVVWGNPELIDDQVLGWRELISEGVIPCDRLTRDELRDRYIEAGLSFDPDTVRFPPDEEQCTAPLIGDFLVDLDHFGFESRLIAVDGEPRLEPLTQARFRGLPLSQQLFHTVASPPIAYLLLSIGMALLLFEFFTAGIGVAGVVGAVLLVLASYGLWVLPYNTWALALLVASMVAFGIDIQTSVPRFWTGAGLVMFAIGTWWLYDGVSMSWIPIVVMVGSMAVAMISGMPSMVRTRFSTPTIGRDWMIGEQGEVIEDVSPDGVIRVRGSLWRARTNRATPVMAGDPVRVAEIDGLWLQVEPLEGAARDYRERRK